MHRDDDECDIALICARTYPKLHYDLDLLTRARTDCMVIYAEDSAALKTGIIAVIIMDCARFTLGH